MALNLLQKIKSEILTRCAGNPHPLRGKSSPAAREIRNPKSEIRNPKSERNPKLKSINPKQLEGLVSDFFFQHSDFLRISDFGFRISRAAGEDFLPVIHEKRPASR
ncbi:MAG TPA: hypothetical protein VN688_03885 [Gemmataceae bacterium]|nr:hypothetical protein [Gemmataceae bacterium]